MAIDKNADFTPSIPDSGVVPTKLPYNPTGSFKFWAQKVLPLVYDDSLSYYEVLCKVVNYLNNVIQNVDNLNDSVNSTNQSFETLKGYVNTTKDTLINTYNELQDYVNTYFDNLDVQEEINAKLDAMADSGELTNLLAPFIPDLVTQWLNNHVTPTSPVVDNTLSISGAAADAKVTGDNFTELKEDLNESVGELKNALSNLFMDLTPTIYSNKTVRISGLVSNSDHDTYRYEIPDGISSVHILTNFYGTSRIIFTNQSSDAVFSDFPMEAYPEVGYEFPTTVNANFQTNDYKYAYVPIYKASGVIPKALYSEKEIINNKVDKSGIGQITETNTTFFEEIPSKNILSLTDSEITESPLTLVIEDNHVNTTISENLTSIVMPIFSEITLTPGTYTCGVYADEDYANYGGGVFIGLYKGIYKNELYQYVFCIYAAGTSKTFTVEKDITLYLRFRTQYITECNTNYATFGSIGCRIIISKTNALMPWVSPDPTYDLIWPATETPFCANAAMFETIGVIGDSYASGQIYLSGSPVNYYNLSWGQVLARRIGSTCINFSSGGLTTKTWLAAEKGLPLLQSSPAQGLYIVALGINDYTEISSSRYTLGTSADFDLSDYVNTPDTFYGNMCKIIGYIQAKSPNAKIILSTMAKNQNTLQKNINNAILTCATLANIGAIKQYEDGFFNSDYYINGMISGHPTAPVYSGMAKAIERLIDKCMNDNYDYFYTYTWSVI